MKLEHAQELFMKLLDAALDHDEAFIAEQNLPTGTQIALRNLIGLYKESEALQALMDRREAELGQADGLLLSLLQQLP